jgi:hypothetical protein
MLLAGQWLCDDAMLLKAETSRVALKKESCERLGLQGLWLPDRNHSW